ncbi:MAG: DUF484 family protein, partial [Halothiobacillus sp.]
MTEATVRIRTPELADIKLPDAPTLAAFLAAHPDYFASLGAAELSPVLQALLHQQPKLVAELTLPLPPAGVTSLPHAQLQIYREQLARLKSTLNALRATAESNAALDRVLHEFACALLCAPQRTAEQVVTLLHQHFAVDTAQLIALQALNPATQGLLEGFLASRTPLCGRLSEAQRHALFGAELPDTGSAALIAIGANLAQPRWILALGRIAPDGFNPSQGTLFLTQIGEL